MNIEELTLLGILITALITIVGWVYTSATQYQILKLTRQAQRNDREISIFRERLHTIQTITSNLIDLSVKYIEINAAILSNTLEDERSIVNINYAEKSLELTRTINDPAFVSILSIMESEKANNLNAQFRSTMKLTAEFHSAMSLITPDNKEGLLPILADKAIEVSNQLINTARLFAEEFSSLEKKITERE